MVTSSGRPLGLLGWLLSILLEWACGESDEPESPSQEGQARAA